jgi:arginyl-tRNA synthetase
MEPESGESSRAGKIAGMLIEQKQQLVSAIERQAQTLLQAAGAEHAASVSLDRPKQAGHGDLACSVALQLAKPTKKSPRDAAQAIVAGLQADPLADALVERYDIAGPGFINMHLRASAKQAVVQRVLQDRSQFGRNSSGAGAKVMVEFVSANPTGPLHVGHGRQGALGDCLSALLEHNGWKVQREFYYNDAGAQINNLALSVQARARGLSPDDASFPADGYRGDYIADIARDFLERKTVSGAKVAAVTANGDVNDVDAIRHFAVAYLRNEQDLDLLAFGIVFDEYYLESSLYSDGLVEKAVSALGAAGKTYEQDGALWLRSTDYGDDKDRVMRKSEGGYTYFVPDVAYHTAKWQRGFTKAINVQGSDHHGTIARVRAGLQGLGCGIPQGFPDYVLHKMVTVMRDGEEVKISKRAGSYVTLRDLIEWSGGAAADNPRGRDAVRFFLISRKADTEFVFDVDLALSRSDENPVYYVQYAHARICQVLNGANAGWGELDDAALAAKVAGANLSLLTAPREYDLMARLAAWPDLVKSAAEELAPHAIAFYLKDLSADLHSYYNAERVLVDDAALKEARLALMAATRQVLRNGLRLVGVSAPNRM